MKKKTIIIAVLVVIVVIDIVSVFYKVQHRPLKKINNTGAQSISFRQPTFSEKPVVVGAKIEHITIPQCKDCYADIVTQIDGVSDDVIIQLNGYLTYPLFIGKDGKVPDIRKVENRKSVWTNIEKLNRLQSKVTYIGNDVVGYWQSSDIKFSDVSVNSVESGTSMYAVISPDGKFIYNTNDIFGVNLDGVSSTSVSSVEEKVLNYFYSNGQSIVSIYAKMHPKFNACHTVDDFPGGFYATLHPQTGEVVYENINYHLGKCKENLQIAIPISDIFKYLPQYIGTNSVLMNLKK